MSKEKKSVEKFLKILEKYEVDKNYKCDVVRQLNNIMNMDFNINHDISTDYYKSKYPQFNDKIHSLLHRCAKQHKHDYRKENQFRIKRGKFIIEYN